MKKIKTLFACALVGALAACGGGGGGGDSGSSYASSVGSNGGNNAPTKTTITGTILDRQGQPVSGVTVYAFHHNDHTTLSAVSGVNGAYSISGLDNTVNADYGIWAEKAGLGFSASVSDPAGNVSRMDFNGLYRTVIRFITMPAHTVQGANFTALRAGDKLASLARTGQTVSYALGDDGALASGTAWPSTRFADNGDGTVSDKLTGLVWLRNAGCFAPSNWQTALNAANALASGACGLSDGSKAGQWRMPNVNELESLVDVSRSAPAVQAGAPFSGISLSTAYWSSTTYTAGPGNAMAIRFTDGRWINGVDANDGGMSNAKASASNALWAVRTGSAAGSISLLATGVYNNTGGGSFGSNDDAALELGVRAPFARFVDKGDGTLADTLTGLTWLKKADCIQQDWGGALSAVRALASGQCGLSDGSSAGQWRMPNRAELMSLSDRAPTFPQAAYYNGAYQASATVTGPVVFNNFIVSDYYWTSSTDAADITQAWALYSCDFGAYNLDKTSRHYTLAVR